MKRASVWLIHLNLIVCSYANALAGELFAITIGPDKEMRKGADWRLET